MRTILFALLLIGTVFAYDSKTDSFGIHNIIEILKGFLERVNTNHDFPHTQDCLARGEVAARIIMEFIEVIKHLKWDDKETVFNFFLSLFDSLKEVFDTLDPCVKISNDITRLIAIISQLNIGVICYRAAVHLFDIFCFITDAIMYFENGNYEKFGENIGELTFVLIIKSD